MLKPSKPLDLYPYRDEDVVGGGLDASSILAFVAFCALVGFQIYLLWVPLSDFMGISNRKPVIQGEVTQLSESGGPSTFNVVITPTAEATRQPTEVPYVLLVTPTSPPYTPDAQSVPLAGEDIDLSGYAKQLLVGRFSNYWPPYGGTNCFSDCELFADGSRVDAAIAENWKVLACPRDWLLGTRFEFPPGSGNIFTCRDYGDDIFSYVAESGLTIHWFDFLSPVAFVDFGSYIQIEVYIPCGQVACD